MRGWWGVWLLPLAGCEGAMDRLIARELQALADTSALEDGDLHVVFGGTGTLSSDADRVGSSVAILAGGEVIVIDAGPGSTRVLASHKVPLAAVSTVLITHLHSDHYGDLGELTIASEIMGRDHPVSVYGPPGTAAVAAGFEAAYAPDHQNRAAQHPGNLHAAQASLAAAELDAPLGTALPVFSRGGIVVEAFAVDHRPVEPALGYRVTYAGRTVVVSGDTAYFEPLAEFARGADLLIHEAMDKTFALRIARISREIGRERTAVLIEDALPNHSTAEDAARIAQAAGVGTLALTHISPPLISPMLRRQFVRSARRAFDGEVFMAEDGMRVDLEAR